MQLPNPSTYPKFQQQTGLIDDPRTPLNIVQRRAITHIETLSAAYDGNRSAVRAIRPLRGYDDYDCVGVSEPMPCGVFIVVQVPVGTFL